MLNRHGAWKGVSLRGGPVLALNLPRCLADDMRVAAGSDVPGRQRPPAFQASPTRRSEGGRTSHPQVHTSTVVTIYGVVGPFQGGQAGGEKLVFSVTFESPTGP